MNNNEAKNLILNTYTISKWYILDELRIALK